MKKEIVRCPWCNLNNPKYVYYHDHKWGVPVYDDRELFEMLILEGAQAGLSWETILNKKEAYQKAFDNFEPQIVAYYKDEKVEELCNDKGIVRNRLKIKSAIKNANVFLAIQAEFGSFSTYLWSYVNHQPIISNYKNLSQVPTSNELSKAISKDLKKRGMNFVGETIIFAYLEAIGVMNNHLVDCFKHPTKNQ